MFDALPAQPADPILGLGAAFRDDPRRDKLDLGVGIYRDADGRTPVMRAVKEAERTIWETQDSKSYLELTGDPAFAEAMRELVLGDSVPAERVAAAATSGGTGAVRMALELMRAAAPGATLWLPDPTWPSHVSMAAHLGLKVGHYGYYDATTGAVDPVAMGRDLAMLRPGDVIVLHGCCHNPTGADPTPEQWDEIVALLERTGAVPLIDLAYLGFGAGPEADAGPCRLLAERLPEAMIAASCSKTFGLYRDRAGLLLATARERRARGALQGMLAHLNRQSISFPPDHGGRVVSTILGSETLRARWSEELGGMRGRLADLRARLCDELRRGTGTDRFDGIGRQSGMFSLLPLPVAAVTALREKHGVYMVGNGRINLAGLCEASVPRFAAALCATLAPA